MNIISKFSVIIILNSILFFGKLNNHAQAEKIQTDIVAHITSTEKTKIKSEIKKINKDQNLQKTFKDNYQMFQDIQKKLRKAGLPEDFAYIIIVESKMNPKCKYKNSHGLWQINSYTGKKFGSTSTTDLYNIETATNTAINYLLYLQKKFDNNHKLMLYAYNCGDHKVQSLVRKYGKQIPQNVLPKISKQYLPKLLAAKIVLSKIN